MSGLGLVPGWSGVVSDLSQKERLRRTAFFSPLACGQPASGKSLRREYLGKSKLVGWVVRFHRGSTKLLVRLLAGGRSA